MPAQQTLDTFDRPDKISIKFRRWGKIEPFAVNGVVDGWPEAWKIIKDAIEALKDQTGGKYRLNLLFLDDDGKSTGGAETSMSGTPKQVIDRLMPLIGVSAGDPDAIKESDE